MAEMSHIATPYAKATFELALENNNVISWYQFLINVNKYLTNVNVKNIFSSPNIKQIEIANVLFDLVVLDDKNNDRKYFLNFLKILAENKRLLLLPAILSLFEQFKSESENKVLVDIITAFYVEQDFINSIKQKLVKRFNTKIIVNHKIDEKIIGGLIIKAGDLVIDNSIRNKLERLKKSLLS